MIIAFCILGYIAMIAGMYLWEAFIGLGYDWDGYDAIPLPVAACAWPIAIPILLVINFLAFIENTKQKRIEHDRQEERVRRKREEQQEKLRIAALKEEEAIVEQVEKELKGIS